MGGEYFWAIFVLKILLIVLIHNRKWAGRSPNRAERGPEQAQSAGEGSGIQLRGKADTDYLPCCLPAQPSQNIGSPSQSIWGPSQSIWDPSQHIWCPSQHIWSPSQSIWGPSQSIWSPSQPDCEAPLSQVSKYYDIKVLKSAININSSGKLRMTWKRTEQNTNCKPNSLKMQILIMNSVTFYINFCPLSFPH